MEAQLNIRRNVMEVQDAVKDLLSWEKDVKLKRMKSAKKSSDQIPCASAAPIRGRAAQASSAGIDKPKTAAAVQKPSQITVKPALKSASSNDLTSEGWKERGNDLFKANQFRDAKDCYTKSLVLQPSAIVYANRGLACLKLHEYAQAEEDCSKAINLDPTYLKAYQRRATVRRSLDKMKLALEDFEYALRLEPSSQAIKADRDACLAAVMKTSKLSFPSRSELLQVIDEVQRTSPPKDKPGLPGCPDSSPRQSGLGSSAAVVEQVSTSTPQAVHSAADCKERVCLASASVAVLPSKDSGAHQEKEMLQQASTAAEQLHPGQAEACISARPVAAATAVANQTSVKPKAVSSQTAVSSVQTKVTPVQTAVMPAQPTVKPAIALPSQVAEAGTSSSSVEKPAATSTSQQGASKPPGAAQGSAQSTQPIAGRTPSVKYIESIAKAVVAQREPSQKAPRTSTDFYAAWRGMKGDLKEQVAYLSLITPNQLPSVLKNSLTADLLTAMVRTLLHDIVSSSPAFEVEQCVQYLEELQSVPRFDMNAMCIMPKDKATLKELFQKAISDPQIVPLKDRLDVLRKKYRLL